MKALCDCYATATTEPAFYSDIHLAQLIHAQKWHEQRRLQHGHLAVTQSNASLTLIEFKAQKAATEKERRSKRKTCIKDLPVTQL